MWATKNPQDCPQDSSEDFSIQDLRSCDEFSGFQTISRGLRPREIVQLRKSYDIFWIF